MSETRFPRISALGSWVNKGYATGGRKGRAQSPSPFTSWDGSKMVLSGNEDTARRIAHYVVRRGLMSTLRTGEFPRGGRLGIIVRRDEDNPSVDHVFEDRSVLRNSTEKAEKARIVIGSGKSSVFVQIPCPNPQLLFFGHFGGGLWGWRNAL
jgi:hypothetical protein